MDCVEERGEREDRKVDSHGRAVRMVIKSQAGDGVDDESGQGEQALVSG